VPILHTSTQLLFEVLQKQLPQSLLLYGDRGVGLQTLARELAGDALHHIVQPQNTKGETDPGGTISVEIIRQLYDKTRSKNNKTAVIIIDNADKMTHGAQNAFLKLLEEPNQATHFILTAHQPTNLLPTVKSRVQQLHVQPISTEQSKKYTTSLGVTDATKQTQLLFLAGGRPAEIYRLVHDEEYFSKRAAIIGDARTLITAEAYQRMTLIQRYKGERETALQLIDSALGILRLSLGANPQIKIVSRLDKLLLARERIAANQSVALQLARAVL
jgi:DNA polymerase III subunit delta'